MTGRAREIENHGGDLSAGEVARFLRRLSRIYDDPRTGNPALSRALSEIASALGGRNIPLSKAISKSIGSRPKKKEPPRSDEFSDIDLDKAKEILSRPDVSKSTLVALGFQRFGIPESALKRRNIRQAIHEIRSSVEHELSLRIIAKQASRVGASRSS